VVGEEVRRGDLVLTVSTTGQIRSESVIPLKLESTGIVTEVLARPGDHVKKNQPIVKLDLRPFDIAVAEAEASLRQAQLTLLDNTLPDSLVSGKSVTGERLRNAEVRSGIEAARAVAGVDDVVISVRVGETLVPLPEGSSYTGFIFATGDDPISVERSLRAAHAHLRFTVAPLVPVTR